MAQNLLEAYSKRIKLAESVYSQAHGGEKMDNNRKLALARCLNNINSFVNEAFENSTGTQRSDMGLWKKFCLNLTNVALPNLIANDLVIVHPMASMSGVITYVNYVAGSNKGATKQGDVFNNPFRLGKVDPDYTSNRVVETVTLTNGAGKLAWKPIAAIHSIESGERNDDLPFYWGRSAIKTSVRVPAYGTEDGDDPKYNEALNATNFQRAIDPEVFKVLSPDGYTDWTDMVVVNAQTGEFEVTGDNPPDEVKVAYVYDNVVIPQNDLPILNATMESIPLLARARRIAVYYSQIAAFQAKTDYGFDLGDQLAEKAIGQLQYEIDTEVVNLLDHTAGTADASLIWSKTLPVGVSKTEHYEGFAEVIENARVLIYNRTLRFAPNYMLIASNVLPILTFMKGFSAAPAGEINGPYFAGTLNGLKVYVSPALKPGRFCLGVNGNDMMSSVAVYAPYMPIVPTQLLQYADGGNSQGFSTLYDLKVLNKDLIVAGEVVA